MGKKVCGGSLWSFEELQFLVLPLWLSFVEFLCIDVGTNRLVTLLLFLSVQYKTCKDGSVLGVTVMRIAMLTHCQAITQSCSYTEGSTHIYSC